MKASQASLATARAPGATWLMARIGGAVATLAVGGVHLQQYATLYSSVPTIGTLFVLNFAGATAIALVLLAPLERLAGRRGAAVIALAAPAGIGLAATSFTFLLISEHTTLFGFHEPGYDPRAIAFSRVAELVAVALLSAFAVARFVVRVSMPRW
jgi:hypothetical protein